MTDHHAGSDQGSGPTHEQARNDYREGDALPDGVTQSVVELPDGTLLPADVYDTGAVNIYTDNPEVGGVVLIPEESIQSTRSSESAVKPSERPPSSQPTPKATPSDSSTTNQTDRHDAGRSMATSRAESQTAPASAATAAVPEGAAAVGSDSSAPTESSTASSDTGKTRTESTTPAKHTIPVSETAGPARDTAAPTTGPTSPIEAPTAPAVVEQATRDATPQSETGATNPHSGHHDGVDSEWLTTRLLAFDDALRSDPVLRGVTANLELRGRAFWEGLRTMDPDSIPKNMVQGTIHLAVDTPAAAADVVVYGTRALTDRDEAAAEKAASRYVDMVLNVADLVSIVDGAGAAKGTASRGLRAAERAVDSLPSPGMVTAEGVVVVGGGGGTLAATGPRISATPGQLVWRTAQAGSQSDTTVGGVGRSPGGPDVVGRRGYSPKTHTAGTGGIERIEGTRTADGGIGITVAGTAKPSLPARAGLERQSTSGLPNRTGWDRAHAYGRQFGDEAAAGVMYADSNVNRSLQGRIEESIRGLYESRLPGEEVKVVVKVESFPLATTEGRPFLRNAQYDLRVVDAAGSTRIGARVELEVFAGRDGVPTLGGRSSIQVSDLH